MKVFSRVLIAVVAAIASLFVSTGTSHAGLDNELSLIDGQDRTLTIQQWDTFLNGVFPLDRNRLTREWFHSGRAKYIVAGPGADEFEGTLELGYQIGFPWSLGVGINFSYTTPNILLDDASIFPDLGILPGASGTIGSGFAPLGSVITPNLFPGVSISADLGNGPGIQEVATFSVDVAGPQGGVAVSNAHGTVTGAAGGVLLRPFARLISSAGDSVTTYGEPWNMN
ncbi:porin [Mycolicibacterium moriokaense]|uniref:Porin MspA n=1 Tax=Mycolicibacterium moriokaense TaxID=39691 RepID=A0AAD1H850_9MYCO|nr:MspA family porin [Mycolicibacterium moriokaense]MCV7041150.1 MspA family porin [Mycolicibacterium moriokaense]ORB27243.1 porin [Mycolicibacterium moriokaense]BBX00712.1 porin MspA [Mycolicibacterium moriokaense]